MYLDCISLVIQKFLLPSVSCNVLLNLTGTTHMLMTAPATKVAFLIPVQLCFMAPWCKPVLFLSLYDCVVDLHFKIM